MGRETMANMSESLITWDPEGVAAWEKAAPAEGGVFMHSLRGFIDAGRAGALIADHILSQSDPIHIASFAIDELLDYRSRRPEMTFSINQWTDYDEPHLDIDMVMDRDGHPFLFLHGFEPDVRWEAYIEAVRDVVDALGATLVLGAHGIPMAAPHTRPLTATVHGTSQELLPDAPSFFGTVTVPASAQNLMEYRFGQWGIDAINVAIHVPHYLAQSAYPQAAQRGMQAIEEVSGLRLGHEDLDEAATLASEEIVRQMSESEDVQALVTALEEQYDEFLSSRENGIPLDGPLPSADELGAEFEKFLSQQRRDFPPHG